MRPLFPLALLAVLTGCPEDPDTDTGPGSDADTTGDTDPGTDPDTDTDSDTDTDVDSDFAMCTLDGITPLPFTVSGDSFFADYPNDGDFSLAGEGGCAQARGPEATFQVSLEADDELIVVVGGGELSGIIHIKSVCDTATECLASVDQDFDGRMEFTVPETGDYYVIVEAFNANPADAYSISMGIEADEICDDDLDNDVDGFVDCADFDDCGTLPECIEVCDDELDNDGDGLTDCDDVDSCFGVGDCSNECIDDVVPVTLPYNITGSNFSADFDDDRAYEGGTGCTYGRGHEHVMAVPMVQGRTYLIADRGAADITLRVMNTCIEADSCIASQDSETLNFVAPSTGTFYVVVEGWSSTPTASDYDIVVAELAPEDCSDGVDNDLDGLTDCDDTGDCFDTAACPFECPSVNIDAALASGGFALSGQVFDDVATRLGPYEDGDGCSTGEGTALVYEVNLAAGQGIRVADRAASDVVWRVMDSCQPGDACLASTDAEAPTIPFYEATAAETVFVIVQAYFATEADPFSLYLQLYEGDVEVCDDDVDNDANGAIDCFDSACFDATTCVPVCDPVTQLPAQFSGSDFYADFPEVADYRNGRDCTGGNGADAVFQVDLIEGDEFVVEEVGGLDVVLRILEGCGGGEICLESQDSPERLTFTAPATGEYTVVVEALSQSPFSSNYSIRMGVPEDEICDDGLDNDLDGAVDCGDTDCYDPVTCIYECPGEIVSLPFAVAGSNFSADFPNDVNYSTGEDCTTGNGHEAIFQVDMLEGEAIQVAETGGADVTVRMLGASCFASDTCFISQDGPENFVFSAPEDGLYTVVIEGWSSFPTTSSYNITIDAVPPEDCSNGEDDDLDGIVDCFDPDCYDPTTCPIECMAADATPLPFNVSGTDFPADYDGRFDFGGNPECTVSATGVESFYDVTLNEGDTIRITEGGTLTAGIRVLDECSPNATCLADTSATRLDFTAPADGVYTVVVEAIFGIPAGVAYDIDIVLQPPEICDSTQDEDDDGLIDCADPNCFGAVGLCDVELDCFDGVDEDDDGNIDCDDLDCVDTLGCPGAGTLVFEEDFDTWPLTGWTVAQTGAATGGWVECSDIEDGCAASADFTQEYVGAAGSFAFITSADETASFNATLTSPVFSLADYTDAVASFDLLYDFGSGDIGGFQVSIDGGTTWPSLAVYRADTVGPQQIFLDDAAGEASVQVRFLYLATDDRWFAVDNLRIDGL